MKYWIWSLASIVLAIAYILSIGDILVQSLILAGQLLMLAFLVLNFRDLTGRWW